MLSVVAATHSSVHPPAMLKRFELDWLLQTNPNWDLTIVHDGPDEDFAKFARHNLMIDQRISVVCTPENKGTYGHYWRNYYLQRVNKPYMMLCNADSQIAPVLVSKALEGFEQGYDVVMWHMAHHHYNYEDIPVDLWLETNHCDFASFAVRSEIGQAAARNMRWDHFSCDGSWAEEIFKIVKDPMKVKLLSSTLVFQN